MNIHEKKLLPSVKCYSRSQNVVSNVNFVVQKKKNMCGCDIFLTCVIFVNHLTDYITYHYL